MDDTGYAVGETDLWPPLPTPPGPNRDIIEAAKHGWRLPPGEIRFTPPLVLQDTAMLIGTAGRTVLRPTRVEPGALVIVQSSLPGDRVAHYPNRMVVQDVRIEGVNQKQTGMIIRGANMTLDRVTITGCLEALYLHFAVNVQVRDSLFDNNRVGIAFIGTPEVPSVTTVRVSGCRIARSGLYGVWIRHGYSLLLDSTIIENNSGTGLQVERGWATSDIRILLRDVWFEANGHDIFDPLGLVKREGHREG